MPPDPQPLSSTATRPKRRFGSVIGIREEKWAEYLALHADVWPGVLEAFRRCHFRRYSVFWRRLPDGNRYLFRSFEYDGDDYAADLARLDADQVTQEWRRVCRPCQIPLPDRAEGEWWAEMDEIFYCE